MLAMAGSLPTLGWPGNGNRAISRARMRRHVREMRWTRPAVGSWWVKKEYCREVSHDHDAPPCAPARGFHATRFDRVTGIRQAQTTARADPRRHRLHRAA